MMWVLVNNASASIAIAAPVIPIRMRSVVVRIQILNLDDILWYDQHTQDEDIKKRAVLCPLPIYSIDDQ